MAVRALDNPALEVLFQAAKEAITEAYMMGKGATYKPTNPMASDALKIRQAVLTVCDIEHFGRGRSRRLIPPKWAAVVLLRDRCKLSFPEIAGFLGYQDHTTMMYAYRNQGKYPDIARIIEAATRLLDEQKEEQ